MVLYQGGRKSLRLFLAEHFGMWFILEGKGDFFLSRGQLISPYNHCFVGVSCFDYYG